MKNHKNIFLISIFIFVVIHFLKDITQDILQIQTPLDIFGNIQEDISFMPKIMQYFYYYILGGFSVIAELLLIFLIPKFFIQKSKKIYKWIIYLVLYLIFFLLSALVFSL